MNRSILLFVLAASACLARAGEAPIFADGFESPRAPDCVAGLAPASLQAGDLGPAPGGSFQLLGCLEVANDRGFERSSVAWSGVPIARDVGLTDDQLSRLALVAPGNRQVAAQFSVVSRWGGPLADDTRPIRWLGVSAAARVGPGAPSSYALVRYAAPPVSADPQALVVDESDGRIVIDTGIGRFTLDPAAPALFERIEAAAEVGGEFTTIVTSIPGAGPFLELADGTRVNTSGDGAVVIDPDGFEVIEVGALKAVVRVNGHLVAAGGASLCDATDPPYERFGYTLVATFYRGRSDVLMQYQFRNECSNGDGEPWDDQVVNLIEAGWRLPLSSDGATAWYAGSGDARALENLPGTLQVRQRRGGGSPWQRRADVRADGEAIETAESFDAPLIGVQGDRFVVLQQMPWMRFREPQALTLRDGALSFDVVTENLVLGEGKGLWNFARLAVEPAARAADIEALRADGLAELERGLLWRAEPALLAASRVIPPLGTGQPSAVAGAYRDYLETIHANMLGKQWAAAKTYGSQLWPDVQFNEQFGSTFNATPFENNPNPNYWNPSGAELLEFLRSGEPQWVWDFALPQSWLQTFTAYLNVFDKRHGRSNGATVNSGGFGEGNWHRNAFGSDDYTYNRGMALAYALRPSPAMQQRFGHAGQMVIDRYGIPREDEASRDFFLSRISPERGILQHFENLANCAEFVPGDLGMACHEKLMEVVDELTVDNLRAGMICQGDVPDAAACDWPQTFMITAMQYGFFLRLYLNYDDVLAAPAAAALERTLTSLPAIYYDLGMDPAGGAPQPFAEWAALQSCSIVGNEVDACERFDNGDGVDIIFQNRPHTLSLGMLAHWLDPTVDLCEQSRTLLDQLFDGTERFGPLSDYLGEDSGWYKGAAQVVQMLVYAVGLYETRCR
ncbi:MAG: hypothetical protein AAGE01_02210 [Pseudomonadota bacterium]